jgi:hypothetical protein
MPIAGKPLNPVAAAQNCCAALLDRRSGSFPHACENDFHVEILARAGDTSPHN